MSNSLEQVNAGLPQSYSMSDVIPHTLSGILYTHRILCWTGISVICVTATPDDAKDPIETKSFRYQTLQKVLEIYNVNLSLSDRFDKSNPALNDDYYLNIVRSAFVELDKACTSIWGLLQEVEPDNLSVASRRIIEALTFITRIQPDKIIHLGSLRALTAQPLPLDVSGQLSIMCRFVDSVRTARTFFTDTFPGPESLAEDWQSCGFRSRSHFLRDVMVPIAVTQTLGASHFLRWIALGLQKTLKPHWFKSSTFEAGDLIYDPETYLTPHSQDGPQCRLSVRPGPWTSQFRGVWTYPEIGSYLKSAIYRQEGSVAGKYLDSRLIQCDSWSSSKRILPFRNSQGTRLNSRRISEATPEKLSKILKEETRIQHKRLNKVAKTGSEHVAIASCDKKGSSKLEIVKPSEYSRFPKQKYYSACPHCSTQIFLPKDMERHLKTKHGRDGNVFYCPVQYCKRSRSQTHPFDRLDNWRRHMQAVHKVPKPRDSEADAVSTQEIEI